MQFFENIQKFQLIDLKFEMNLFAIPFPDQYIHQSIYENFNLLGRDDLKPGTFSFFYSTSKYFFNLQTNKTIAGIYDHFSFSLDNEKNQTASSISLYMPHDFNVVIKSPREFEANIMKGDNLFKLTDRSLFYTGIFPLNDRGHDYDMSFTVTYPTPVSLMCQFLRPGGCFGNSIELLPNISIYSVFGKGEIKNISFKISYSTCDKYITKCLLGFMIEHKGPFIESSYARTINTLGFNSVPANADNDEHIVVGTRDKGIATHSMRIKLKITEMINFIAVWRIGNKNMPNSSDFSIIFNIRRKKEENSHNARKERNNFLKNQNQTKNSQNDTKFYSKFFHNLRNHNFLPNWKKMKYIHNNDPFGTSLYSFKLRNDALSFGLDYPINSTQNVNFYIQYNISTKKSSFQFNLISLD